MTQPDFQPSQFNKEYEEPIISLGYSDSDTEEFDYDFDYDPNEMYWALQRDQE